MRQAQGVAFDLDQEKLTKSTYRSAVNLCFIDVNVLADEDEEEHHCIKGYLCHRSGEAMCSSSRKLHAKGFSLVELMMAIAIGAVLLSVAAPALSGMLRNNRVVSLTNALLGTVHRLRVEAITKGVRTTACTSLDGLSCSTTAEWHDGWIAFPDADVDGERDEDEALLLVHGSSGGRVSAKGNTSIRRYVSFISSGRSASLGGGLQMGTITICEGGTARLVVISASGRPRTTVGSC